MISAANDRSRQINLALLQSQQSSPLRNDSLRQSGVSRSSVEQESILRMSRDNEQLMQMVSSRRLPTLPELQAASYEGKYKFVISQTADPKKTKGQSSEHVPVPSHIVPPKKKKEEPQLQSRRQSSVSVASASSAAKLKE